MAFDVLHTVQVQLYVVLMTSVPASCPADGVLQLCGMPPICCGALQALDTGPVPPPRGGHASVSVGTKVLVFGGADRGATPFTDLWCLETGACLCKAFPLYAGKSQWQSLRKCVWPETCPMFTQQQADSMYRMAGKGQYTWTLISPLIAPG